MYSFFGNLSTMWSSSSSMMLGLLRLRRNGVGVGGAAEGFVAGPAQAAAIAARQRGRYCHGDFVKRAPSSDVRSGVRQAPRSAPRGGAFPTTLHSQFSIPVQTRSAKWGR